VRVRPARPAEAAILAELANDLNDRSTIWPERSEGSTTDVGELHKEHQP